MKTSAKGIELIKAYEGLCLLAYRCPAGVLTIGYGTTSGVKQSQVITEKQAEDFLVRDLQKFEWALNDAIAAPITQGIFDALACFTYNVGEEAFRTSTLLGLLNKRKYALAGDQLLRWDRVDGKQFFGLTRRRQAERRLFYSQAFPK